MPSININGVRLGYRMAGSPDKRAIVFAHPVLFGSGVFDALVSELSKDFHLVFLDIHGHGESGYRTPLTLEDMTSDYYQLLTRLGISKCIWLGYSIGGMLGMRMALTHPEAIDSLILIATAARPDPPQLREQTGALWEMFRDGYRENIIDLALPMFFAPATFTNQPHLVREWRNKVINYKPADGKGMFESAWSVLNRADISDQISGIKARTVVIAGKDDVLASPEEAELITSRIPDARLAIVEEASHLLVLEKPEEVAGVIRDFLKGRAVSGGVVGVEGGRGQILVFDGPADSFFGIKWSSFEGSRTHLHSERSRMRVKNVSRGRTRSSRRARRKDWDVAYKTA